MKPITEVYPGLKDVGEDKYFCAPGDYGSLLDSLGYDIVLQVDDHDYQGDSRLIFKNGDSYGMLIFGWGSCSGCDALQGCESIKEIEELRDGLANGIIWRDSAAELLRFFEERDWATQYSWHAEEGKKFVADGMEYLRKEVANG